MTDPTDLPGLPECAGTNINGHNCYTADQMRAYALAALRAAPGAVAWDFRWSERDRWRRADDKNDADLARQQGAEVRPLYTHPAPAAVEGRTGFYLNDDGSLRFVRLGEKYYRCEPQPMLSHDEFVAACKAPTTPTQGEWVMVPKEATPEMVEAMRVRSTTNFYDWADIYAAMVAAAPVPALDTGNLIDDPLYNALDALYDRGWMDYHQKRKHDPRGTNQWQAVLDLFRAAAPKQDSVGEADHASPIPALTLRNAVKAMQLCKREGGSADWDQHIECLTAALGQAGGG